MRIKQIIMDEWIKRNEEDLRKEYAQWASQPHNDYNPDGTPGFQWWAEREYHIWLANRRLEKEYD